MTEQPMPDWLVTLDAELEVLAAAMKRERPVLRRFQPPLRRIVAKHQEGPCMIREELECGHSHMAFEFPWEATAKRRRCWECRRNSSEE